MKSIDYSLERKSENEYYSTIKPESVELYDLPYLYNDMIEKVMENIFPAEKYKILDVGAGLGILSVRMALSGARVTALDISDKACDIIKLLTRKYSVDGNVNVVNGTLFEIKDDEQDDRIVFLNSLHHMLNSEVLTKIKVLLKRGGKVVLIEPLKYNPLAFLYRRLFSGQGRTEIEKPIGLDDIKTVNLSFRKTSIEYMYLLSSVLLSVERAFNINERGPVSKGVFRVLNFLDRLLLKLPIIKYMAWKVLIVAEL